MGNKTTVDVKIDFDQDQINRLSESNKELFLNSLDMMSIRASKDVCRKASLLFYSLKNAQVPEKTL